MQVRSALIARWLLCLFGCGGMIQGVIAQDPAREFPQATAPIAAQKVTNSTDTDTATAADTATESAETDEEDEEDADAQQLQHAGLKGVYRAGSVTRTQIDPDIAFDWGQAAPLQTLPTGPFDVEWSGRLLVRTPGLYRLHVQTTGRVTITLNGKLHLETKPDSSTSAAWHSGSEVELEYGLQELHVHFQSMGPRSLVKLYWSADSFALEPIPTHHFFLHQAHPELNLIERGRDQYAAHRCNRCHQRDHEPLSPAAPDLRHVASGLTEQWLQKWLSDPSSSAAHRLMPDFNFNTEEAQAISAFLMHQSTPVKVLNDQPPPVLRSEFKPSDVVAGKLLFHTLGCLACHACDAAGQPTLFGGGDLTTIGAKRSADWLRLWLTKPDALNADHQMPVFELHQTSKANELEQLVAYLSAQRGEESASTEAPLPQSSQQSTLTSAPQTASPEKVQRGQQLVAQSRCAACHRLNGLPAELSSADLTAVSPDRLSQNVESPRSCLQLKADRSTGRPAYPHADRAAIAAYLASRRSDLVPEGPVELGRRLLTWKNCLQCHPRNGTPGLGALTVQLTQLFPELSGQNPTLVPPALNAVGDKLLPEALLKAVAGEFDAPRLNWLKVRMPRFAHRPDERQALAEHFIRHDLIENPPEELQKSPVVPTGTDHAAALVVGHSLLGSQGFSCIACHQFGKFQPRNTALGTRGSDLMHLGRRMRRDYFLRWVRSPIRIIPDMEMPGFERPLPEVLDGRVETQLAALWEALHDSNNTRPLDIASIQQIMTVEAGAPARVIRDVFALPQIGPAEGATGADAYIPRSFAVGLNSHHNMLFDLDHFQLRAWWWGDLGRQRTEGKSWYWDLGGARIWQNAGPPLADLALLVDSPSEPRLVRPELIHGTRGRLVQYQRDGDGLQCVYRLNFPQSLGGSLVVTETWQPLNGDQVGWSRRIEVAGRDGSRPIFLRPAGRALLGQPEIRAYPTETSTWKSISLAESISSADEPETVEYLELGSSTDGRIALELRYTADLQITLPQAQPLPALVLERQTINTLPGYQVTRLPLPRSIMPTAITWTAGGELAVASLKGHVYKIDDSDGDELEDRLSLFEEGLAAPFGLIADPTDHSLIVAQKPELLRLRDLDGDGRADSREVVATGWGYNDNYHDWTCGIVRDRQGNLYVGLGSDYTQPKRPMEQQRWRGKILRIEPSGTIAPIASGLRYPTGLALDADDRLYVSDNQGEQNVFNELNHIVAGQRYGVPSREDRPDGSAEIPAIQFPHPWTRSINGIFFIPPTATFGGAPTPHQFAGHGIGCEYDSRYLIRFTLQEVDGVMQGAVYPFSRDHVAPDQPNFEGTLCGAVGPQGDIYIGCIHDSGWLGGLNVGSLYRLQPQSDLPTGIREIRAFPGGFTIDLTGPIDPTFARKISSYSISAYTRVWQGGYSTPDSGRHQVAIRSVEVSTDQRRITLNTDPQRAGYVYEITLGKIAPGQESLWPSIGHYTMKRVPPVSTQN